MDQDLENTVDDLEFRASPELLNKPAEVVRPMDVAIAGQGQGLDCYQAERQACHDGAGVDCCQISWN